MAGKIPVGTLSTNIELNGTQPVRTLAELKRAVRDATSAWKAQQAELKSTGNAMEGAEAKYKGLGKSINAQADLLKRLKSEQAKVDTSTSNGAEQYSKLGRQIATATTKYASLKSQQDRAKSSMDYYKSGLADTQKELKSSESVTRSYVDRLQSEGKSYEAAKAKQAGYRSSLENLNKQQNIQEAELSKIASTVGKSSDAFKRQQVRVNETATSINKTKSSMSALNDTIKKANPSVFDRLKNKLHGTSNEAKDTSHNIADIAKGSAIGNMASNGISNLGSALWSAAENGFKLDEAGEELKKRWSDLGLPKRAVKGLMDQISRIRGLSNASGSAINQLQRSLYNLTNGNVGHVKALTNELFAFGKQAGLSDDQIAGMGQKLTRVFSQSKVRLAVFNRTFGQMPGLRNAIIKASGMTKKAFNDALASGRISGTQLQSLMIKASSNSGKAWERFGSTTKGQLAEAQGQYTNMAAMFMKPIEFVSIKALSNSMSQLVNKRGGLTKTGSAIQDIVKNLSKNIGKGITNTIDFIVHHIQGIKTFGEVVAGAFAAKKIYDFTDSIRKGIGEVGKDIDVFKSLAKSTNIADVAQKLLNTDEKANPIGLIAVAVTALGVAFYELYNHCKPFRNFINGIGKQVVKVFDGVVKFFKNNWKEIGKLIVNPIQGGFDLLYKNNKGFRKWVNSLAKNFKNAWKGVGKWFGGIGKGIQKSWKGMTSWFTKLGKNMSKGIKSSWEGVTKWFSNVGKGIQKNWKGMTSWFTKLGKNMAKGLKSAWRGVTSWFSKVGEGIQKAWHGMTSWFSKLGHGMASGLKSSWEHVTGWFSDIGKGIRNAWRGMTSWFSQLGSNMASGIKSGWHGMTSWFTNLAEGIKGVFDHLWSGIKDGAASIINTIIDDINGTGKNISNFTHGKIKFGKIEHVHFYQGTGPIKNPILGILNDGSDSPATGNREGLLHKNGLLEILNGTNIKRLLLPGDEVIKASDMASLFHFANGTVAAPANNLSTPTGQNSSDLLVEIADDILQAITGETVYNFTPARVIDPSVNTVHTAPATTPLSELSINNKTDDKTGKSGKSANAKDQADIKDLKDQITLMQKAVAVTNQFAKSMASAVVASKQFSKSMASIEKQVKTLYATLKKNPFGKYISSQATLAVKTLEGKGNFAKLISSMNYEMSKDIKRTNSTNLKNIKSFSSSMIKTFKSLSSDIKKIWSELWSYADKQFKSWRKDELSGESSFKSKFTHGWESMDSGIKSEFDHFWSSMHRSAVNGLNDVIKAVNSGVSNIDSVIKSFGGNDHAVSYASHVHMATGTGYFGNQRRPITKPTLAVLNDGNDSPETGNKEAVYYPQTGSLGVVQGTNVPTWLMPGAEIFNALETKNLGLTHFASGTGYLKKLYEESKAYNKNPKATLAKILNYKGDSNKGGLKQLAQGVFKATNKQATDWWSQLWEMVMDKVNDGGSAKGLLKAVEEYGDGHEYVWGASGPSTFDCSGLVMYALKKKYGISYPHFSGSQYAQTEHIGKGSAKMGDLVFWGAGGDEHVGVYAGGNKYFSAQSPSQGIHMNTLSSVVGYGAPKFGRVRGLNQDSGDSSPKVKANNTLQKLIKGQVGTGFWKTIQKIADEFGDTGGMAGRPTGDHMHWMKQAHIPDSWVNDMGWIIDHESGWNPNATNPSSGTYGLGQMQGYNLHYYTKYGSKSNPIAQLMGMRDYIKDRYGNAAHAKAFWEAHNSYANGGIANVPSIFGEAGPEMAIPLMPAKSTKAWELIGKAVGILTKDQPFNNSGNDQSSKKLEQFMQRIIELLEILTSTDKLVKTDINIDGRNVAEAIQPYEKQQQRKDFNFGNRGFSNGI